MTPTEKKKLNQLIYDFSKIESWAERLKRTHSAVAPVVDLALDHGLIQRRVYDGKTAIYITRLGTSFFADSRREFFKNRTNQYKSFEQTLGHWGYSHHEKVDAICEVRIEFTAP